MSWVMDYLGKPWQAGAQGPEAYDCWGLFRAVQREQFGVEVPVIIAPDYDDPRQLAALFREHDERARWQPVEVPQHGDAVIVRSPLHIGVWLDYDGGGVLHSHRGAGVVFTRDAVWQLSGFGRREYYRRAA